MPYICSGSNIGIKPNLQCIIENDNLQRTYKLNAANIKVTQEILATAIRLD